LFSCNKNKDAFEEKQLPPNAFTRSMGFSVGSYWVYNVYRIDTADNEILMPAKDSCYLEKDTTINGKLYLKFVEPNHIHYWRDSFDYIVSHEGEIIYAPNNFTDTFIKKEYDSIATLYRRMCDKNYIAYTPEGAFETKTMQTTTYYKPRYGGYYAGKSMQWNVRYAHNIGIVVQTTLLAPDYHLERRLCKHFNTGRTE
jgi:hypothetical protein